VKHIKGFGKSSQNSNVLRLFAQAKAHHRAGHLHDAEALYRQILKLQADHLGALQDLGGLLCLLGNPVEGEVLLSKLVALKPNDAFAHYNLGVVRESLKAFAEAKLSYEMAIALAPSFAEAYINLGDLAIGQNQFLEAQQHFQNAISLNPNSAEAHCGLGCALFKLGEQRTTQPNILKAESYLRKAIRLKPNFAAAHYYLGTMLLGCDENQGSFSKLTEAVNHLHKALILQPELSMARCSLGTALMAMGQFSAARICYDEGIAQEPNNASIFLYHRSLLLLLLGDFRTSWFGFDQFPKTQSSQDLVQPCWDGSALPRKRILLRNQHGFGDAIQFIRYAPLLKALGAIVIVEYRLQEERLFRTCEGVDQLVFKGDTFQEFDVHATLYHLPKLFKADLATIPAPASYLSAPEACHLPENLQDQLRNAAGLKVGIAWSSKNGCSRRCPLSLFEPLLQLPGLSWFSLYKGDYSYELEPYSEQIINIGSYAQDFADTAWAIEHLDLVITVDTSVAHLAGAMGKSTWVLLPFVPDWRWLLEREDSPWYPTARLFRQPQLGDWFSVIKKVESTLVEISTRFAK
jgi:tetratricopeptide (TPR) repeat protein